MPENNENEIEDEVEDEVEPEASTETKPAPHTGYAVGTIERTAQ